MFLEKHLRVFVAAQIRTNSGRLLFSALTNLFLYREKRHNLCCVFMRILPNILFYSILYLILCFTKEEAGSKTSAPICPRTLYLNL